MKIKEIVLLETPNLFQINIRYCVLFPVGLIVSDEMAVSMPGRPDLVLREAGLRQLVEQLVVEVQVGGNTEQVGHQDHVTGLDISVVPDRNKSFRHSSPF